MNLDNVNDFHKKYITRSQEPRGRGGRKKVGAVLLKNSAQGPQVIINI